VIEVQVGYDGIVIANSDESAPVKLSRKDIFLALAAQVPGAAEGELIENPLQNLEGGQLSIARYSNRSTGASPDLWYSRCIC